MHGVENLILLAEDDEDFKVLIETALEEGHIFSRMETVADGAKALDYLNGKGVYQNRSRYPLPSLLMIDLKLPRMDGFQVLQWVRSRQRFDDMPVVVLTGLGRQGESQHAYELGADAFYVKPFHFRELTAVLKEIWDSFSHGRHPEHILAASHR